MRRRRIPTASTVLPPRGISRITPHAALICPELMKPTKKSCHPERSRGTLCSLLAFLVLTTLASAQITINPAAPAHPLPHFWEHMFGSGRANLSLRESYRRDLRDVKQATG